MISREHALEIGIIRFFSLSSLWPRFAYCFGFHSDVRRAFYQPIDSAIETDGSKNTPNPFQIKSFAEKETRPRRQIFLFF